MPGYPGEHALKDCLWLARINCATAFVRESDHAIHMREIAFEFLGAKSIPHIVRHGCRTINAGNHSDVIARTNAAIWSSEALKITHLLRCIVIDGFSISTKLIIATE